MVIVCKNESNIRQLSVERTRVEFLVNYHIGVALSSATRRFFHMPVLIKVSLTIFINANCDVVQEPNLSCLSDSESIGVNCVS